MGNRVIFAKKINIMSLIEALQELYDFGVDYVDVGGEYGEDHDTVLFSFPKDYMQKDSQEDFEDIKTEVETNPVPEINISLTDEDLNQLS